MSRFDVALWLDSQLGEANHSCNLGLAYEELGDLSAAIATMQVCVNIEQEIGHPDAEADAARVDELRTKLTK